MQFLTALRQKPMMYATLLVVATAFLSGTNNFLTKIAVTAVQDPVVFTTLKNAVVALFIFGLLIVFRSWREIPKLSRRDTMRLIRNRHFLGGGSHPPKKRIGQNPQD